MSELMSQASDLVLYGMGTVFTFLTVLVGATMLMSYLVQLGSISDEAGPPGAQDPKILAAISAAVKQYRGRRH